MAYVRSGTSAPTSNNPVQRRRRWNIRHSFPVKQRRRFPRGQGQPRRGLESRQTGPAIIIGPDGTTNLGPANGTGDGDGPRHGAPESASPSNDSNTDEQDTPAGPGSPINHESQDNAATGLEGGDGAPVFQSADLANALVTTAPGSSPISHPTATPPPTQGRPNSQPVAVHSHVISVARPVTPAVPIAMTITKGFTTRPGIIEAQATSVTVLEVTTSKAGEVPQPTATDDSSGPSGPPISQNPPIIVGILLATLMGVAAIAALISWILRTHRRRHHNRMVDLDLSSSDSGELYLTDSTRKTADGFMDELENLPSEPFRPKTPTTPRRHVERSDNYLSEALSPDMYPSASALPSHMHVADSPYVPAFQIANIMPGDISRGSHNFENADQSSHFQPNQHFNQTTMKGDYGAPRDQLPRSLGIDGDGLDVSWRPSPEHAVSDIYHHEMDITDYGSELPWRTGNLELSGDQPPTLNPHVQNWSHPIHSIPPVSNASASRSGDGSSWASSLKSNLGYALDAVKKAAGDKMPAYSWPTKGVRSQSGDEERTVSKLNTNTNNFNDRFTPLALRPGRKSFGMDRLTTKEGQNLSFGGPSGPSDPNGPDAYKGSLRSGSGRDVWKKRRESAATHISGGGRSSKAESYDEAEGKTEEKRPFPSSYTLEGLGNFSFEQRSKAGLTVTQSSSLSRRHSRMGSESGSGSGSGYGYGDGTGYGGTMRKRKSRLDRHNAVRLDN